MDLKQFGNGVYQHDLKIIERHGCEIAVGKVSQDQRKRIGAMAQKIGELEPAEAFDAQVDILAYFLRDPETGELAIRRQDDGKLEPEDQAAVMQWPGELIDDLTEAAYQFNGFNAERFEKKSPSSVKIAS